MFAYCLNNPVNGVDPSGTAMKIAQAHLHGVTRQRQTAIDYFTPSNIYGSVVGGSAIVSTGLCQSVSRGIQNSIRPTNIGVGLYAKQCANDLAVVSKFDDGMSKALGVLSYGVAAIDVGIGIYDNIQNDASTKKIVVDAVVDAAISGGSIWAAGAAGSAIGTAVGTVIPGAGNLVGAAAGFVIGVGLYITTDMIYFNGKTARTWVKEGANSLW